MNVVSGTVFVSHEGRRRKYTSHGVGLQCSRIFCVCVPAKVRVEVMVRTFIMSATGYFFSDTSVHRAVQVLHFANRFVLRCNGALKGLPA